MKARAHFLVLVLAAPLLAAWQTPAVPPPTIDPAQAARMIALPRGLGLKLSVWATEPMLENPVAFAFDEQGRLLVSETHRIRDTAVLDNRARTTWPSPEFRKTAPPARMANIADETLDAELANRTAADREAMVRRYFVGQLDRFTQSAERIRLITDKDGDGKADDSQVFAGGFNGMLDGVASGVLSRRGDVWFTNIPTVWLLRDRTGDGVADERKAMSTGYGVRYAFMGHDMHGLRIGPDGKLYWSIGDRGAHVVTEDRRVLATPDTGAVFRSNLDGTDLEMYATGLRNPQELAFDEHGNLFTGDNNSDGGDKARLVHVVEGGDSGWRIGYQYLEAPNARGPWNAERLWEPAWKGQAAYIVPPVSNITNGPSGITYHPGTGAPSKLERHFFLADFRGQASTSGIHAFQVRPRGAGFQMFGATKFAWGVLATDVEFGPDGAMYLLDWVFGWTETDQGRVYRITDPAANAAEMAATRALIAGDWSKRGEEELAGLLGHADARVRQEAQFTLVEKGGVRALVAVAATRARPLARLHAVWGLGQLIRPRGVDVIAGPGRAAARPGPLATAPMEAVQALLKLAGDGDAEVRAQVVKVLGEGRRGEARDALVARLARDPSARVRFFAALALGKLGGSEGIEPLLAALRRDAGRDPWLRHAAVMGLALIGDGARLLDHAGDKSAAARAGVLLALRRMGHLEVRRFLRDRDPAVVREAARAINDFPIDAATADLAALMTPAAARAADPVVLPRIINAAYRVGSRAAAQPLVTLGTDAAAPEKHRREALLALATWNPPTNRDRVTGIWHPLPTTGREPVQDLVEPVIDKLLAEKSTGVLDAAVACAARLKLKQATPGLLRLVSHPASAARQVRLEALRALDTLGAPELRPALEAAARDPELPVRLEALALKVKVEPARALDIAREVLAGTSLPEKQVAVRIAGDAPGPAADKMVLGLVDELVAGKLPPELTLDVLEAAAKRKGTAPPIAAALTRFEAARGQDELAPYREVLAGGDIEEGKQIFWKKAEVSCARCHTLEGHGAEVGPALAGIARKRPRPYLLEAVVFPSKHFAQGYESVLVTMKDGTVHGGTVVRDTGGKLVLRSPEGAATTLDKAEIKSREPGASGMPDGFGQILSKRELRNLVEFLASLK